MLDQYKSSDFSGALFCLLLFSKTFYFNGVLLLMWKKESLFDRALSREESTDTTSIAQKSQTIILVSLERITIES